MEFVQIGFGVEFVQSLEPYYCEWVNAVFVNRLVRLLVLLLLGFMVFEYKSVSSVYVVVGERVACEKCLFEIAEGLFVPIDFEPEKLVNKAYFIN